jgi:hypothetical protein
MHEETLEYLEQVLSGLRARFASGDKSVEDKLRAVAAKVDQLKLHQDSVKPKTAPAKTVGQQVSRLFRRKSCCR